MVDNLLGMLLGGAIDREDGDSGVVGAATGYVAEAAVKVVAPLVLTFAIGWGVQKLVRMAYDELSGDPSAGRS